MRLLEAAMLVAALAATTGCYSGPVYAPPDYDDDAYSGGYDDSSDDVDPPAAYVATNTPVYYGGRANYWYRNTWRYRERGRWNGYRREPDGLRRFRARPGFSYASTRRYEGRVGVASAGRGRVFAGARAPARVAPRGGPRGRR